jgi:hypothetical protein
MARGSPARAEPEVAERAQRHEQQSAQVVVAAVRASL